MERRRELVIVLLVLALSLLFAMDTTRFFLRVDLTEDRLFTISRVSQQLFKEIPDQVHITYYISDKLRSVTPVPNRIIDLLQEYAVYSHGRILVSIEDPSQAEVLASVQRAGIPPQQIQVIEQNEQRVTEVYSGLVIQYLDRSISIPFVFNPDTLEYSLTLTIRRLVRNTSSVAGIIIGGTDKSLDRNYSMLSGQLSLSFNLRDLKPGEEIPPNISVLIVLGGTDLSREQLAPIDRYIMGGGRVLFAVKGLRVETNRKLDAKVVGSSPLLDMIANYGVEVGREMVLDESSRDYRLPQVVFGTVKWQVIGKYPEWVSILPENVSETNPITRRFPGLDLLWPSPLTLSSQEGVSAEVLLRSSASSWLATAPFTTDPFKLVGGRAPKSSKGRFVLAYALSGRFPSYYTGGDETETATPAGEGVKDRGGRLGGGDLSQDTRMIIIGDDDFASDLMQFSDSAYNALFLENAAEWLSSDSDLLAIKTRVSGDLRLNRIQDPKARERHIQAAEAINVVGIPLFVLAMGLLRLLLRREGRLISRSILRQHKGEKRR